KSSPSPPCACRLHKKEPSRRTAPLANPAIPYLNTPYLAQPRPAGPLRAGPLPTSPSRSLPDRTWSRHAWTCLTPSYLCRTLPRFTRRFLAMPLLLMVLGFAGNPGNPPCLASAVLTRASLASPNLTVPRHSLPLSGPRFLSGTGETALALPFQARPSLARPLHALPSGASARPAVPLRCGFKIGRAHV